MGGRGCLLISLVKKDGDEEKAEDGREREKGKFPS